MVRFRSLLLPVFVCALASAAFGDATLVRQLRTSNNDVAGAHPHPLPSSNRFGDEYLIAAENFEYGRELWLTDGTNAGTRLLADINGGADWAYHYATPLGDTIWISANDGRHGIELWKSDGTAAGTVMVKDIAPGPADGISTGTAFGELNGIVYFAATDAAHGVELWRTDGTAAGTFLFADLTPGPASSRPTPGQVIGGRLLFQAANAVWSTDGTEEGTIPLTETGVLMRGYTNSALFLSMNGGELWRTDGTPAGTFALKSGVSNVHAMLNDEHFFTTGAELWKSDGSLPGTLSLGTLPSAPHAIITAGTKIFLFLYVSGHEELWTSGGTQATTGKVTDLPAVNNGGMSRILAAAGSRVVFARSVDQVWSSDGTAVGTGLIATVPNVVGTSSRPTIGDLAVFVVETGQFSYGDMWVSDGTSAGTVKFEGVETRRPGAGTARYATTLNGKGLFTAHNGTTQKLWSTDGTSGGTTVVSGPTDRVPGYGSVADARLSAGGDRVYFPHYDRYSFVWNPWSSTGNGAVEQQVSGAVIGEETRFVTLHDVTYYIGTSGTTVGLYATTGSMSTLVFTLDAGAAASPIEVLGDHVYFFYDDGASGRQLWRSNGTSGGTTRVTGGAAFDAELLAAAGGALYFTNRNANGSVELRLYTAGSSTTLLSTFARVPLLAGGGASLFFFADDGIRGTEPWWASGTAHALIADLNPSGSSFVDVPPVLHGGRFAFTAFTPTYGAELWSTDLTAAGTLLLADVQPGPLSSKPIALMSLPTKLVFLASTPALGYALYEYTPAQLATTATATSATSVLVSWTAVAGAGMYDVYRTENDRDVFQLAATGVAALSTTINALTPNKSYLFKALPRTAAGHPIPATSTPDLATTVLFTDDPLVVGSTTIKLTHFTQLAGAINVVRTFAGLSPFSLTAGTFVTAATVQQLRDALTPARTALGLPTTFTTPTLAPAFSVIRAMHVQEIREQVK